MFLIFKVLNIFVFLFSLQAMQHSGCWGDTSIPIFSLDKNESYAFIGLKWSFLTFCPLKIKRRQVSSIFKNNENRGGIYLYDSRINQLFKTLAFSQIFRNAFKPNYCQILILNNIIKMAIFQRCIGNPVKHLRWSFSQEKITAKNCKVFSRNGPS